MHTLLQPTNVRIWLQWLSILIVTTLALIATTAFAQEGGVAAKAASEAAQTLFSAGNPNTPWFGHGTPQQREDAFIVGLYYGLDACIQYYTVSFDGGSGADAFLGMQNQVYLPAVMITP